MINNDDKNLNYSGSPIDLKVVVEGTFDGRGHIISNFYAVILFTILNACNIKSYHIKMVIVLWPDDDVVAFVLDAEVAEFLDWYIFVVVRTDDYTNARSFRLPNTVI